MAMRYSFKGIGSALTSDAPIESKVIPPKQSDGGV